MRITLVAGKGGVGRSTLSFLLSMALARAGQTVSFEDHDPQESLTQMLAGADWITQSGAITIVDTPPRIDSPSVLKVIASADRILVPTSPSPTDLMAVKATMQVVQARKSPDASAVVVLNKMKRRTSLGVAAASILGDLGVPVAATIIPERQGIQRAALEGWTAMDVETREAILSLAIETIS